jgi:hypothetical protein
LKRSLTWIASGLALALGLSRILIAGAEPAPQTACPKFSGEQGGYQVSTAFSVEGARHDVVTPPRCLRAGDLLSIWPLRLNADEYLVLQECKQSACEIVRAWNSSGYMGPYPVLGRTIPIEDGRRYLLWMQRVPMPGNESFRLINRHGPPLVFEPIGRLTAYGYAQSALRAAIRKGPERITRTVRKGTTFVATFEGGSVVRMRALHAGR